MLRKIVYSAVTALSLYLSANAVAIPITYEGNLTNDVTEFGFINDLGSDWWTFSGTAGDSINLTVNRLDADLDPAFDLFFGFGDTDLLTSVASADDNVAEFPGLAGPFSDPQLLSFLLPSTGIYSVNVWDFLSNGQDFITPNYQITLGTPPTGPVEQGQVPVPATLLLFGLGLIGMGLSRRKA